MVAREWNRLADELSGALRPTAPPIGIAFSSEPPDDVPAYDAPMAPPTPDGRTGRVPAGCVFWMKAVDRTFSTIMEDHGNCSVGSVTHGWKSWDDVGRNADVAAILEAGWVTPDMIPQIPFVTQRPGSITYGPLAELPVEPDVVLVRLNARSLMVLSDALPDLRVEGKPQCHIVAVAKEHGEVAASVGCMLSRARTGIANTEVTCAIPATKLAEVVDKVRRTAAVDAKVWGYAAEDARRFA